MRVTIALAALFATVASALTHNAERATPTTGTKSLNPPPPGTATKRNLNAKLNALPRVGRDTNAKRLAAGLPLLRPHRRFTPTRPHAPRQTSSVCTDGVVHVTYDGADGYLSTDLNQFGEYTDVVGSCDSTVLHICAYTDQPSTTQSIVTVNAVSPSSESFFGATLGFASDSATLGTGSDNYIYITNTDQSDASLDNSENSFTDAAAIDEPAESEVWTIAADGTMTVVWTNPDGTTVPLTIGFNLDSSSIGTFFAVGNFVDFENSFGASDEVTFTFVPSSSLSCAP
ncbi:hypothetical protein DL93DRAFT_2088785 [Clavulina sp. PMI_390]|nr:hypothetical protein DL93DRAFT_2088785 [Clavulina sp. PMI_390]